jgi:hypothetical protein
VKRRHARTLAAALVFATCAAALGLWAGTDAPASPGVAAETHMFPDYAAPVPPDLAALGATLSRPLFNPSRRPPPRAAKPADSAAPDAAAEPPPVARLIAVATGPGRKVAILQLSAGGTNVLMEGEQVGGWTLSRIEPRQVTLRAGEREATFSLPQLRGPT